VLAALGSARLHGAVRRTSPTPSHTPIATQSSRHALAHVRAKHHEASSLATASLPTQRCTRRSSPPVPRRRFQLRCRHAGAARLQSSRFAPATKVHIARLRACSTPDRPTRALRSAPQLSLLASTATAPALACNAALREPADRCNCVLPPIRRRPPRPRALVRRAPRAPRNYRAIVGRPTRAHNSHRAHRDLPHSRALIATAAACRLTHTHATPLCIVSPQAHRASGDSASPAPQTPPPRSLPPGRLQCARQNSQAHAFPHAHRSEPRPLLAK
jgi:hypothetical protein